MLTVKNNNDFNFAGRYNGIDYHFPRGKVIAIPDEAAKHIFGIGSADKNDILVRNGWLLQSNQIEAAMEKLNGFAFNVANEISPGDEVTDTPEIEQGSAPLQLETSEEVVADDTTELPGSNYTSMTSSGGGSILDKLTGGQ